jgi:hypothetical protein
MMHKRAAVVESSTIEAGKSQFDQCLCDLKFNKKKPKQPLDIGSNIGNWLPLH